MLNIGLKLNQLRVSHDLSLDMLAADINQKYCPDKPINKSMISRWENGVNDPSLENAKYLSLYFNVSLDYLTGLSDIKTPSRLLSRNKKG